MGIIISMDLFWIVNFIDIMAKLLDWSIDWFEVSDLQNQLL